MRLHPDICTPPGRCTTPRCRRLATVWLAGPERTLVPGCRACSECAASTFREYRQKLDETWHTVRLVAPGVDGSTPSGSAFAEAWLGQPDESTP